MVRLRGGKREWAVGGWRGGVGGRALSRNETLRHEGGCQVIRNAPCLAEGNGAMGQTTHLGRRWQPARRWVHEYVKIFAERGTKCRSGLGGKAPRLTGWAELRG